MKHLTKVIIMAMLTAFIPSAYAYAQECGEPIDTTDIVLQLDVYANPLSGYRLECEQLGEYEGDHDMFRIYHLDSHGNRVRQVVVLTDSIPGHPEDLNSDCCGGNIIVALTPKEMEALKAQNRIWGEMFVAFIDNCVQVTGESLIPVELTCYKQGATSKYLWKNYSGEVMKYTDEHGRDIMCLAANRIQFTSEYSSCMSDGKYDSVTVTPADKDAERRYLERAIDYYGGQ